MRHRPAPDAEPIPDAGSAVEQRATDDGFATLYSTRYGQTYHSRHGAGTEARHVFLDASGAADRLAAGRPTRVLEVGFGTGLNFLVTAHAALDAGAPLTFVSLERDVLPAATLDALGHGAHFDGSLSADLIAWRRRLPHAVPAGRYSFDAGAVTLVLLVGDALGAALPEGCDAVYLDAFSPDANPELWTVPFLRRLHAALRPAGRLTTYSAKGSVRRALAAAGFEVAKRPGPPGKREMTAATRAT